MIEEKMYRRAACAGDLLVGLDVGGTKTEAVVIDQRFNVRGRARRATATATPAALVENAVATIRLALGQAGAGPEQITMIGAGIPGQVVPGSGEVRLAANLQMEIFPLGDMLAETLRAPVVVENDVRAAALGSYHGSDRQQIRNMVYVNVGTGVSAGLILDGGLYRGTSGMAGEIGHVIVEPGGAPCNCGQRGCLETLVAGPAIARAAEQALREGAETSLRQLDSITTEQVYQAAKAGDGVAARITARVGAYLGRMLHGLVMAYDVERIILGGGVTRAGDLFLQLILREWSRYRKQSALARAMLAPDKLRLADPTANMVAYGAAALAVEAIVT